MPITGNRSSSRSAVNTRSGTSPPEMLRLPRSNAATGAEGAQALDVRVFGRRQHLDVAPVVRDFGETRRRRPRGDRDRGRERAGARTRAPGRRSGCWRRSPGRARGPRSPRIQAAARTGGAHTRRPEGWCPFRSSIGASGKRGTAARRELARRNAVERGEKDRQRRPAKRQARRARPAMAASSRIAKRRSNASSAVAAADSAGAHPAAGRRSREALAQPRVRARLTTMSCRTSDRSAFQPRSVSV